MSEHTRRLDIDSDLLLFGGLSSHDMISFCIFAYPDEYIPELGGLGTWRSERTIMILCPFLINYVPGIRVSNGEIRLAWPSLYLY